MNTLLDIAKANGSDAVVGLIDETTKAHPELTRVPARTIKGISYKTLVRVALGQTSGGFRNANEGVSPVKSRTENRSVETFILESRWKVDKAVADSFEDGPAAYIAIEAAGLMEGEMQALAAQMYYGRGTGGNAKGYPGLIDAYDATNMVVDAGGTTANTGSSAWLVKFGPQHVQWVWGNNGQLALTPSPAEVLRPILVTDPNDATKEFLGYMQTLTGRPGLQVGSLQSVVRIKKLTADSGKGLTDALVAESLAKFPVGMKPDVMFINRRSAMQLQKSRTVTINAGPGASAGSDVNAVAASPTSSMTIPVEVTDAISSTESLTL